MFVTLTKADGRDAGLWFASFVFPSGRVSSWTRTRARAVQLTADAAEKVRAYYARHAVDGAVAVVEELPAE